MRGIVSAQTANLRHTGFLGIASTLLQPDVSQFHAIRKRFHQSVSSGQISPPVDHDIPGDKESGFPKGRGHDGADLAAYRLLNAFAVVLEYRADFFPEIGAVIEDFVCRSCLWPCLTVIACFIKIVEIPIIARNKRRRVLDKNVKRITSQRDCMFKFDSQLAKRRRQA